MDLTPLELDLLKTAIRQHINGLSSEIETSFLKISLRELAQRSHQVAVYKQLLSRVEMG